MDWISNRELAIVVGAIVAIVFALFGNSTRGPMLNLIRVVANPHLIFLTLGFAISALLALIYFEPENGWSSRQIWLSFIWLFTVALPISFRVVQRFREARWNLVGEEITKALSLTFIVDLIANYASFSFVTEIFLVLFLMIFVLAVMGAMKQADEAMRNRLVVWAEVVSITLGLVFLALSVGSILGKPNAFFQGETAINFIVPFLLTVTSSFYLCILFLHVSYNDAFVRLPFFIKDPELKRYAKQVAITSFGLNVGMLKHWLDVLAVTRPTTKAQVQLSLRHAYINVPIWELER